MGVQLAGESSRDDRAQDLITEADLEELGFESFQDGEDMCWDNGSLILFGSNRARDSWEWWCLGERISPPKTLGDLWRLEC